jgi:hypothetical protein
MKLLKWNEEISFGAQGTVGDYSPAGWALGEDNPLFTWTLASEARLHFHVQAAASAPQLRLVGMPYLAEGQLAFQRLWVHLNGHYCGVFDCASPFDRMLPTRMAWFEPRANALCFTLPDARSPKELNLGEDQRRLGVAMRSISFCLV